ncbi:MAG: hypothetical protein ACOCZV_01980 [Nanoarchaeota archaeon]
MNSYVWWDEFHSDPRKYVSNKKFFDLLNTLDHGLAVTQTRYIPMTVLEVPFEKTIVQLLTTIRPVTANEIDQFYDEKLQRFKEKDPDLSSDEALDIHPFYDLHTSSLSEKQADELYLDRITSLLHEDRISLPRMFRPHIRGHYIGELNSSKQSSTLLYAPLELRETRAIGASSKKRKVTKRRATALRKALDQKRYDFIDLFDYDVKVFDRLKKAFPRLYSKEIIGSRNSYGRESNNDPGFNMRLQKKNPESFYHLDFSTRGVKQVPYFDFKYYHKHGEAVFSYVPLRADLYDEEPQTYPLFLTNAFTADNNQPVLLGFYSGLNSRQKKTGRKHPDMISIVNIIDEEFARGMVKSVKDQLGFNVKPIIRSYSGNNNHSNIVLD